MMTEDYVSFETATLLKEKGFDIICDKIYRMNGYLCPLAYGMSIKEEGYYLAPTLQMAMKWLRKVHKLNIEFILNQDVQDEESVIKNYYHFNVSRLDRFANEGGDCKFYNSYEEACEAAIKYCLENLI